MGGRLRLFWDEWSKLTSDKNILSIISGLRLEFDGNPKSVLSVAVPYKDEKAKHLLEVEAEKLLNKQVIEPCEYEEGQVLSSVFFIEKPDHSFRTIFNMKPLNEVIKYHHFKMDTFETAVSLLRHKWWLASVDLKDAYFTVPVNKEDRKYLRFAIDDKLFQFRSMPMGLSSAPRLFTKVMKPVLAELRKKGIVCMGYIDDLLVLAPSKEECAKNVTVVVEFLQQMGFLVNQEKSQLKPEQKLKYLGFMVDTSQMKVFLPQDKTQKLIELADMLLQTKQLRVQDLAQFIGVLLSNCKAAEFGWLHYRELERLKIITLKENKGNFLGPVVLTEACRQQIQWWKDNAKVLSRQVSRGNPEVIIKTDASGVAWGAFCESSGQSTRGLWSAEEQLWSINAKELKAAFLGLQSLGKDLSGKHVQIQSDNVTTVAYIRNMGGIRSLLCDSIASELWAWCIERKVWVSATHIPGKLNIEADQESRTQDLDTEWELNAEVFHSVVELWGLPEVDLFASRINHKIDCYVSWRPDPSAIHIDAFTMSWENLYAFIFPPFSVIARVLQKMVQDKAEAVVILPIWPTAAWFSHLPFLLTDYPVVLPRMRRLLTRGDDLHPLRDHLRLIACRLSGDHCKTETFLRKHKSTFYCHGEKEHKNSMNVTSAVGSGFVTTEGIIPWHRL